MKKAIDHLEKMLDSATSTKGSQYNIVLVSTNDLIELSYLSEGSNSSKTCEWFCSNPSCGNSCGRCENCSCGYIDSIVDYS